MSLFELKVDSDNAFLLELKEGSLKDFNASTKRLLGREFNGSFAVSRSSWVEVLKELSKKKQLAIRGINPIFDWITPYSIRVELKQKELNSWECSLFLVRKNKNISFSNLQLHIGPPYLFFDGLLLGMIHRDIPKRLFSLHGRTLSEKAYLDLIDELSLCEGVEVSKQEKSDGELVTPIPVLTVLDLFGTHVKLNFKYPQYGLKEVGEKREKYQRKDLEEQWIKDLLELGMKRSSTNSGEFLATTSESFANLELLQECGWSLFDRNNKKLQLAKDFSIQVEMLEGRMQVMGEVFFEEGSISLAEAVKKSRGAPHVFSKDEKTSLLIDWSKANINRSWIKEAMIVAETVQVPAKKLLEEPLLGTQFYKGPLRKLMEKDFAEDGLALNQFKAELFPYQQKGVQWLKALKECSLSGMLADEMGLGKTVQVLAFLSLYPRERTLVVTPKSLAHHWFAESKRFIPSLPVFLHIHNKKLEKLPENGIIITTYSQLRSNALFFQKEQFDHLIFDESQWIKNKDTQVFTESKKIVSRFKLALSGTPIENHTHELLTQFSILLPGYVESIEPEELKKKIAPVFLRRKKEELGNQLPEKQVQTLLLTMDEKQKAFYEKFQKDLKEGLYKKIGTLSEKEKQVQILEALLRLRQCCLDPCFIDPNYQGPNCKLEFLSEEIRLFKKERKKLVIVSQFTKVLHRIHTQFGGLLLEGQTKNREDVVKKFQDDPDEILLLMSLKVGGVGLNLSAADQIIIYDPWWNQAVEDQAIDRAHRIGRKNKTCAKRFLLAETIEEKMEQMKASKQRLAQEITDDAEGSSKWSFDELEFLLDP